MRIHDPLRRPRLWTPAFQDPEAAWALQAEALYQELAAEYAYLHPHRVLPGAEARPLNASPNWRRWPGCELSWQCGRGVCTVYRTGPAALPAGTMYRIWASVHYVLQQLQLRMPPPGEDVHWIPSSRYSCTINGA